MDAACFASLVGAWLAEQEVGALAQLAVDGKVLRGSGRQDGKPLQLLSTVTHHLCLTLDQIPIAEKCKQIPALQPFLKKVNPPPGVLITADARHCQQESARFITQELGGDYLFGLKGNQNGIFEKAKRLLAQQAFPPPRPKPNGKRRMAGWSTGASPRVAVVALIRGPWSAIENGDHYRRDVTLGEDANHKADRNGAAVLTSLRNLANGIYELERERKRPKVWTRSSPGVSSGPVRVPGRCCAVEPTLRLRQKIFFGTAN